MTINTIIEDFQLLDDWQDRYRYVIDLGKNLEPMDASDRSEANRVAGCMAQVWIKPVQENNVWHFIADSDAIIVKGLIAILLAAYNHKTRDEIHAVNIEQIFQELGLTEHLSPNRRNGFFAMVERVRGVA